MDERCETCRFWSRQDDAEDVEGEREGWHSCARADRYRRYELSAGQARMYVTAADDYDLALMTAPDFGCTEWRAVGDGIPTGIHRHALVFPNGHVGHRGGDPPDEPTTWLAPDYPAGYVGVLAREIRPVHLGGTDTRVESISVSVTAIGEELFERTWAEAVAEARRECERLAQP